MRSKNFSAHRKNFNTFLPIAFAIVLLFGHPIQAQHLIWAQKAGGVSGIFPDTGSGIVVDASGNSYVVGGFGGAATSSD